MDARQHGGFYFMEHGGYVTVLAREGMHLKLFSSWDVILSKEKKV